MQDVNDIKKEIVEMMMPNKNIEKNIRIMFPENAEYRTQRILKRLRNDSSKDHHAPGSLTWIGRCAVDHAAADLIEQLESQIPRWISVEERLPEIGMMVLVHDGSRAYVVEYTKNGLFEDDYGYCHYIDDYTHWMPLPEPPKEEQT